MAGLATSAKLFGAGIIARLWSLIPGAIFGLAGVYDALVKPYLPPDWQKVSLAVPLPWVVTLLVLGLWLAALLTFHELRVQSQGMTEAGIHVEPGGTYIHAPGSTFTLGHANTHRTRTAKPSQEQLTVWVTGDQSKSTTSQ